MPKFVVKTHNDRNLIIEANHVYSETQEYRFTKVVDGFSQIAALVPRVGVLAIIKNESDQADFYFSDHEADDAFNRGGYAGSAGHSNLARTASEPDDLDDTCLDCRIAEFLDTQEGFSAVADIVYAILSPDAPSETEPPNEPKSIRTTLTDSEYESILDFDGGWAESLNWFLHKNSLHSPVTKEVVDDLIASDRSIREDLNHFFTTNNIALPEVIQ